MSLASTSRAGRPAQAMPCEVIGVLMGKGQSSQGQDQDDLVVMPMRAVPFRVVCLLGMNDGDYPRKTSAADFDLLAFPLV